MFFLLKRGMTFKLVHSKRAFMKIEVKVPSVGESVSTADIESWEKQTGDLVKKGEVLVILETDKASMEIPAEQEGRLETLKSKGEQVFVDEVIAVIDTSTMESNNKSSSESQGQGDKSSLEAPALKQMNLKKIGLSQLKPVSLSSTGVSPSPAIPASTVKPVKAGISLNEKTHQHKNLSLEDFSPSVRHLIASTKVNPSLVEGTGRGGRLTKEDILNHLVKNPEKSQEQKLSSKEISRPRVPSVQSPAVQTKDVVPETFKLRVPSVQSPAVQTKDVVPETFKLRVPSVQSPAVQTKDVVPETFKLRVPSVQSPAVQTKDVVPETFKLRVPSVQSPAAQDLKPNQRRESMTRLRRVTAERLVQSQRNTATLTTFNEVDLSRIIEIRKNYQEDFIKKYGFKLGFMSFFVKAVVTALKEFPKINAFIEGTDIVYNESQHIGIAVSTEKGLVVPVLFHAEKMPLAQIEKKIIEYRDKALARKLIPDDLLGGTFTISNGGVFGSLLSTPILNPPQSGILGMHKIEQRPVARQGQIEIRPMMYLALSYDHRMVDGRESVSFLVKVREGLEEPSRLLIDI